MYCFEIKVKKKKLFSVLTYFLLKQEVWMGHTEGLNPLKKPKDYNVSHESFAACCQLQVILGGRAFHAS